MPRFIVTVTETVKYSMFVDAESGDDAEETALEAMVQSDNINQWFDSVEEREAEHRLALDSETVNPEDVLSADTSDDQAQADDAITVKDMEEFSAFCRAATDAQLRGIHDKETKAGRKAYSKLAQIEADRRGLSN